MGRRVIRLGGPVRSDIIDLCEALSTALFHSQHVLAGHRPNERGPIQDRAERVLWFPVPS
jgi:hypothetical protein